jgi:hypothetical protein
MSIANDIQMLYIGYLGRAADEAGIEYWVNKVEQDGWSVDQVALSFADQVEYQQIYGAEPSREELLKTTYRQLFNREFDEAGLEYWLNGGGKTVPNNLLVQAFINGALGSDQQILANKLEVGNYYTDQKGDAYSYNQEQARIAVLDVNGLDSSVQQAKNSIDGMFNANHIFTLQETYTDPDYVPAQTEVYWGYNPCLDCDGSGDVDYKGIPVTELLSFLETITGLDFFELGLIDEEGPNAFDNIANITLVGLGLADQSQTVDANDEADADDNDGDVDTTGAQLILDFADGTQFTAEARLGTEYMQFLRDLLFYEDADGLLHSRLYEEIVVPASGSMEGELQAIKLTPMINNGGTVETGYTSDANDLIVAGRLELLHGAYIDGGAGTNTLEIDAKGVYAQPLAILNVQHILIENLPNIYTTWTSGTGEDDEENNISGSGIVDDQYPYFNDVDPDGDSWGNSIIDLSRAINIETLTITEGRFDGFVNNGQPGSLTVAGIRNGVTTTLDGGFSQDVFLHYSAVSDDAGVNVVFHNLNMNDYSETGAQLIVAHNADTLNIESTGGGNWLHNADLGGRLSTLNITGDAHLYIQHDLDPSFHDASPVTIDASGNTGGVTLTLSGSQNVTYMGSSADDNIVLSTTDTNVLVANDETVTIVDTAGDNRYEVTSYSVNITDGDGDNNYEVAATKLNLNAGNGNNVIESEGGETAVIVVGDGDNTIDTDGKESVNINAGNGDNTITSIGSIAVEIATGTGNDAIMTSASIITINSGDGDDTVTLAGREGAGDVTGITGSPNLVLVLDGSGSMGSGPGSNLQAQADAVEALLNVLPDDAAIYVVYEYEGTNGVWSTKAAALAIADGLADGTIYGTWDTEGFIDQTEAAFADLTGTYNAGGANEVIFITDGGNQPADEQSWINFLVANDVRANTLGIGADSEYEINTINSLSYDGRSNMDLDGIIASTEELENLLEDLGRDITVMNGNGARVNIDLGEGTNVLRLGDAEDLAQGLVALEGSSITGENIKLVVNADSDLRAADLNGISSVVLDNDDVGSFDRTVDNGMLTLTAQQFADIGAANFSVEGSIFHTYAFVKIIVTEDVSLTDLGVDSLPRNIDLYLEIQDGATLTLTAEQLHTKVAQNGITLVDDGNFDEVNGKVVITGGGLDFDPFNTSDTVKTIIDGTVYNGGSLSSDFMVDGAWYNVSVKSVVNGYDRPADTPAEVILTIDTDLYADPVGTQGEFSTWHTNLEIVGEKDVVFTGAVALGLIQGKPTNFFTVDFSQLDAEATELTLANFEFVKAIYGNSESGYDATVNIQLGKDKEGDDKGWDETDATGLVSSGVAKYVVTLIEGPTAAENDGSEATIKLCDTTQDLEVLALRGNYNDTLSIEDAAWGLAFELQGGTTAKADGPTGTANVGALEANYKWDGADAVVTLTHSVEGDTRVIKAYGITINNADSMTINATGSATIDALAGDSLDDLLINATGNVAITAALPTLDVIDVSGVTGTFAASVDQVDDGTSTDFIFTGAESGSTLTFKDSFTATSATSLDGGLGGLTLVIAESKAVDLDVATLANITSVVLENGTTLELTIPQAVAIGGANFIIADGDTATLNLTNLDDSLFVRPDFDADITVAVLSVAALPEVTLNPGTDLTGIGSLAVAEGTTLNLTLAQFQQLDGAGTISALVELATDFTINITDITQADVDYLKAYATDANGLSFAGIAANATLNLILAESVDLSEANLAGVDSITFGDDMTLTLGDITQAHGVEIIGGANSTLKFTDLSTEPFEVIDASGFDVTYLMFTNTLTLNGNRNVDDIFTGLAGSIEKIVYMGKGSVVTIDQVVTIEAGSTVMDSLVFNPAEINVELNSLTLNLMGGSEIDGNVRVSTDDKFIDEDTDGEKDINETELVRTFLKSVVINSEGTAVNLLSGATANVITGDLTPVSGVGGMTNNLLDLTINASQELIIEGDVVFASNVGDDGDGFASNDIEDAVAVMTVTGDADVTLGGVDTSDDDVDGLNVVNNGTGTLSLTVTASKIDATDELAFTGTGVIELTVAGNVDLSDDDLSAVTEITVAENAQLTLSFAQLTALGAANILSGDTDDTVDEILNIVDYDGSAFDFSALSDELVVNITMADGDIILDPAVDLTGVDSITVPEGGSLTLTAAQFQQLDDKGTISGGADSIVNIIDLTQSDVDAGFDLTGVTGATINVTMIEDIDFDEDTNLNGGSIAIGSFHLGLATHTQADGLVVTGDAASIVSLLFDIEYATNGEIEAGGYDIGTLRAIAETVDGLDVEVALDNLANSVELSLYETAAEVGYVSPIHRTVTIEDGVAVPGNLVFNGQDDMREMRTLTINFEGDANDGRTELEDQDGNLEGSIIDGDLILFRTEEDEELTPLKFQKLTLNSFGDGESNAITGNITAAADLFDVEQVLDGTITNGETVSITVNGNPYSVVADIPAAHADDQAVLAALAAAIVIGEPDLQVTVVDNGLNINGANGFTIDVDLAKSGGGGVTTTVESGLENNLLNVEINADSDFTIGGDIVFSSVNSDADDATATLTVTGAADVNIGALDVSDTDVDVLAVNTTGTGTLTVVGASPSIQGPVETIIFSGTGDIVLGTAEASELYDDGIDGAGALTSVNASALSGDLYIETLVNLNEGEFTFTSGTGVTIVTLTDLDLDSTGVDTTPGNADDTAGWNFSFVGAAAGSELHLRDDDGELTDGSVLNIDMGANGVLYIDQSMDLSDLDLSIVSAQAIVLADGATLTLSAAQADGLDIIAGPDVGGAGFTGVVHIVDLGDTPVDLSGIAADIAGIVFLEDNDVTLDVATDLGFFTVQLTELDDTSASLDGQTIRFQTVAQAERAIIVDEAIANNEDSSTNVVWLFTSIANPNGVDTSDYDKAIGRLWFSEDLINNEGGLVESLYTTLPSTILRVDFTDLTELDILLASNTIDRTMEFVNFANVGNLKFEDTGANPEEHIRNLTLKLGGEATLGNILLDDLVAGPDTDPDSVEFQALYIQSHRALHEDNVLAAEAYLNDNDGIAEFRDGIDADLDEDDAENTLPDNINTIGNIGVDTVAPTNADIDLLNVYIDTLDVSVEGDGSLGSGANIDIGTITYDSEIAASTALLDVTGDNDINIASVVTTDADISALTVDATDFTAVLTAPGTSPAFQLNNTETLTFTNSNVSDSSTIVITADDADDGDETVTVNYVVNGVAGSVIMNNFAVNALSAEDMATAVALALNGEVGIAAVSAGDTITVTGEAGYVVSIDSVVAGGTVMTLEGDAENLSAGTITLGSATKAGIAGNELSFINATNFDGTLNLGVLSMIDGTNEDRNDDGDTTDAGDAAFTFTSGQGVTTMTLGLREGSVPTLTTDSQWIFNFTGTDEGSALTITDDVVFQTDAILTLTNVPLVIEGDVDLSEVILQITGGSIWVPAGNSLTLDVAQAVALTVDIVGDGAVNIIGNADDVDGADLGLHLRTLIVDVSGVVLTDDDGADPLAGDEVLELTLTGGVDDNGENAGQSVTGSPNDDAIVTANDLDNTLNGGSGDDTLTGGSDTAGDVDTFNTYVVSSGTDTIVGLKSADDDDDIADLIIASGGATVQADVAGNFYATSGTTNTGATVELTAVDTDANTDNVIDMSEAGGTSGFSITGSSFGTDEDGNDTLIGSARADIINGGNTNQSSADMRDTLTGNSGADRFEFNIIMDDTAIMTVETTTVGVDQELIEITADDADNDNEIVTVNYTINGIAGSVAFTLGAVDATDANAVATGLSALLDAAPGISSTVAGATIAITGDNAGSLSITSVVIGGTVTTLDGADSNGTDVAQVSTLTISGTPTEGDIYSLLISKVEGAGAGSSATADSDPTTDEIATELATNFVLAGVNDVAAGSVITFTDALADDGGFTFDDVDTTAAFGGSGASNKGATDLATADLITDFAAGTDTISFGLAAGSGSNYLDASSVADFTTARNAADAAFNGTIQYYVTSVDDQNAFDTDPDSATDPVGLLFFDANLDGNVDGVVALVGINSDNFQASYIVA